MENYPEIATERFDNANFHIRYCLSFIRKYIRGNILEIGAGCGSFTRNYMDKTNEEIVLTELDKKNIIDLQNNFKDNSNIKIVNGLIDQVEKKFDTILYFHVLEHIKDDLAEIEKAKKKLKEGGHLIIMVPAHQKIYSNLDKAVGHFRRYEKDFFEKKLFDLERTNLLAIDSIGYFLYYLNKIFFSKEIYPSNFKIFIWDKFFTPLSVLVDFITNYKFGKCFITIYKKNNLF